MESECKQTNNMDCSEDVVCETYEKKVEGAMNNETVPVEAIESAEQHEAVVENRSEETGKQIASDSPIIIDTEIGEAIGKDSQMDVTENEVASGAIESTEQLEAVIENQHEGASKPIASESLQFSNTNGGHTEAEKTFNKDSQIAVTENEVHVGAIESTEQLEAVIESQCEDIGNLIKSQLLGFSDTKIDSTAIGEAISNESQMAATENEVPVEAIKSAEQLKAVVETQSEETGKQIPSELLQSSDTKSGGIIRKDSQMVVTENEDNTAILLPVTQDSMVEDMNAETVPCIESVVNVAANPSPSTAETNVLNATGHQNNVAMTGTQNPLAAKESNVIIQSVVTLKATDIPTENTAANTSSVVNVKNASGLSLLAQYNSDNSDADDEEEKMSDTESVVEQPISNYTDYRNRIVEITLDSDGDSSDGSDSDVEWLSTLRKTIDKRIEIDHDDEDDDEDDECGGGGGGVSKNIKRPPPKVKGEMLLDDLPPIQDLHITVPEAECIQLGRVHSIVDQLVLVAALPDSILLDLETVLFLEKGKKVLGAVFDVLGQVADPIYCVRFNSNTQIHEKDINVGDVVYMAPKTQYTQYVVLSNLMKYRGSDASWENDVEPPPRYLDYSDDEQERAARAQLRNRDRPTDNDDETKRVRVDTPDQSTRPSSTDGQPHQRRGRNGGNRAPAGTNGGYRSRYHQPQQSPTPPQPMQDVYHSQHAGSWHSNYYQPYQSCPPPNYHMIPPHTPPPMMHPHHYNQPPMHAVPPVQYNPFVQMPMTSMPPPGMPPTSIPPPGMSPLGMPHMQQPPPPMYAPSPYNAYSTVNIQNTPPPLPPGSQ